MAGTVAPFPYHQFFDNNGAPAAGYKLFTYTAGTTSKQTTFSDQATSVANTNPIILDSAGRAKIFLPTGLSWKFVLAPPTDSDPPSSPLWTIDNVTSVPGSAINLEVTGTVGENVTVGNLLYLSAGDGGRNAGQWYNANATTDYMAVKAQALGFALSTVTSGNILSIRIAGEMTGLAGLAAGSLYYADTTPGGITASAPTLARPVGIADTSTSLVMSQFILTLDANVNIGGLVNIGTQTFAGAKTWNGAATFAAAVVAQSTLAVTGTSTLTGLVTYKGGLVGNNAPTYQAGTASGSQLCYTQISVAPTGIPASVAANSIGAGGISLGSITGLLANDILVGITKAATQTGLTLFPNDGPLGGVSAAGSANVRFCNTSNGAIVPTASETYTFTVLRAAAIGTSQLVAVQITVVPTGIPGSVPGTAGGGAANAAFTGITGLLSSDVLVGVQKASNQAGLALVPADLSQGGVTGAGAVTVKYLNFTAGAIIPTAGESYTFTVLRSATLGQQALTPVQCSVSPSGLSVVGASTTTEESLGVTGSGMTASDYIVGVNLGLGGSSSISGIVAIAADRGLGGGGSATTATVRFVNTTGSTQTPLSNFAFTFTVLRATASSGLLATASGVIFSAVSVAGLGNSGSSGTPAFKYQLPPNALSGIGRAVRLSAWGTLANNANAKTLTLKFGATTQALSLPVSAADNWFAEMVVFFATTTTQTGWLRGQAGTLAVAGTPFTGQFSPTETLGGPIDLVVQLTGTTNNDMLCNGFMVEMIGS